MAWTAGLHGRPMARRSQRRSHARAAAAAPPSDPWRRGALVVFVVALALRVLYVLSIRHAYFFEHLQTDPLRYHEWATLILDARTPPQPPFEQAPGYPYLIAALYTLCGRSITAVALIQTVFDAVTCVFVACAGKRWFGPRAGLIAGGLAAVYGPCIYFTGELLPATLFLFVSMAAVFASLATLRSKGDAAPSPWLLAGGLWSLALLVRSETMLMLPFVLFDARRRGGSHAVLRTAAPLAVVMALSLGLNAAFSHKLVLLNTSSGVNLWLGNNPHADGVSPFITEPLEAVDEIVRAQATDGVDADRIFRSYAFAFWREQPGAALRLAWKKFLWTWTDRELPNSSDIEWQTSQSWLFHPPLFPLSFGAILPLAVAGALLLGNGWRRLALLAGLLATGIGTTVIFFTNARFRLIIAPAAILLAAVALDRLPSLAREWRHRYRALLLLACGVGLGALAAWADFYGVRSYRIAEIAVNTGALEREAGHLDSAIRHLRDGLADNPRDAIGWIHLALALEQQGHARAALQAYLDALALGSDEPTLPEMATRFFTRQGLDPAAVEAYADAPSPGARAALAQQLFGKLSATD